MRNYEKPILTLYELFEEDIVTASLNDCDDQGQWNQGWSTNAGGND